MRKAPKGGKLHPLDERANHIIAMVRARVEHPFRVIKCQFGHVKTRYRCFAKKRAQLFTLFALGGDEFDANGAEAARRAAVLRQLVRDYLAGTGSLESGVRDAVWGSVSAGQRFGGG